MSPFLPPFLPSSLLPNRRRGPQRRGRPPSDVTQTTKSQASSNYPFSTRGPKEIYFFPPLVCEGFHRHSYRHLCCKHVDKWSFVNPVAGDIYWVTKRLLETGSVGLLSIQGSDRLSARQPASPSLLSPPMTGCEGRGRGGGRGWRQGGGKVGGDGF